MCTNTNETFRTDCEVYQKRCFCEEDITEQCHDPEKFKHMHVEYFGTSQVEPGRARANGRLGYIIWAEFVQTRASCSGAKNNFCLTVNEKNSTQSCKLQPYLPLALVKLDKLIKLL